MKVKHNTILIPKFTYSLSLATQIYTVLVKIKRCP